ncbi:MAG: S41 family peptidase [Planctomycetota bacterium]|nr:S41 family peptidase [Planctomycetota bacterium]
MRFSRALAALVVVLSLLVGAPSARAQALTDEQKQRVLEGIERTLRERAFVPGIDLAGDWQKHTEKYKAELASASSTASFAQAVNRALREFGISHIRLMTPTQAENRRRGTRVGLGVVVEFKDNALVINEVVPRSPAERAGLKPGDAITSIDGQAPRSATDLRGDENRAVELKVRGEAGAERDVTVQREAYSTVRPDTLEWPEPEIAVLKIRSFLTGYDRANIEKLLAESRKARGLIIDLRSNGGGATLNLRHLMSELLPAGSVIGTFVSRRAVDAYVAAGLGDGKDPYPIATWWERKFRTVAPRNAKELPRPALPVAGQRVAVLINRGSGSASEICAAALREHLGAILVGTPSAGAVLQSTSARLERGFSLQYPADDYITYRGRRLEANPLQPDVVVPVVRGEREDKALARAIEELKKQF